MSVPESTPAAPLGLRERKNRRTRLAIVRAAAELTIRDGYAAATIPRIAERADIAPRTVSTWFPAKDDILFEGADETIERGVGQLRSGSGDIVDRLLGWLASEEGRGEHHPELTQLRNEAIQHDPELRARYHQFFERLQVEIARQVAYDTGTAPDDTGPRLLAGAAMVFMQQIAIMSARDEPVGLDDPQVTTGIAFLRAGLKAIRQPD